MSNSFEGPIKLSEGLFPEGEGTMDIDHLSGETEGSYDIIPDPNIRNDLNDSLTQLNEEGGQDTEKIAENGTNAVVDQATKNDVGLEADDVEPVLTDTIQRNDINNDVTEDDPEKAVQNNKLTNAVEHAQRQELIQDGKGGMLKALDYIKTMIDNLMKKIDETFNKKWKSEVDETAETKKSDTDDALEKKKSEGKISDETKKRLANLLGWLRFIGFLSLFAWLVSKNRSDCYYIDGANQTKLGCKGYKDTGHCACPGKIGGDASFEAAAESGEGLDTYCGNASLGSATSSPVCCEAAVDESKSYGDCDTNCPSPQISLQQGLCGSNKYYVYKNVTFLDVLSDMADDAAQAAGDIFNGFQWSFDHIGLIIVGVVVVIAIIVFLKIISLFKK